MYDNEEEIKRKRRMLIYIGVGLAALIIIIIIVLLSGSSKKKPKEPVEKLTCELEVIRGTLGPDNIYNTEVEIGFKKISPEKDITKKTVGEKPLPRNTSTYVINAEGTFKVNGYVQNVLGETATCEIQVSVKPTKPTCELEVKKGTLGAEEWYKTEVEIGFKSANTNNPNTKIAKFFIKEYVEGEEPKENQLSPNNEIFTLKEDKEAQIVGYIQDTNGSEGVCGIKVKKDSTPPTCKLKVESGTKNAAGEYTDNPVIIIEEANDAKSGFLKSGIGIEKNYEAEKYTVTKEGTTVVRGYVIDKAGNEGTCSLEVKKYVKQVTPPVQPGSNPSCTLAVSGTKLADGSYLGKATVTISATTTNGATVTAKGVGLDGSYNNQTTYIVSTGGTHTVRGVVKDSYNHTGNCSVQVKVTTGALLSQKVKVGDKVAYDAGQWTTSAAIPTAHGQSGGYIKGTSKNNSVSCFYQDLDSPKNGWVVLAVNSGVVYLVHAGTPECYYHGYGSSAVNSINILNTRSNVYINPTYASSATILKCNDNLMQCSDGTTTNELHKTRTHYYLASTKSEKVLWGVTASGRVTGMSGRAQGIRPIVAMKANIMTTGAKNSAGAWILINPSKSTAEVTSTVYDYARVVFDKLF